MNLKKQATNKQKYQQQQQQKQTKIMQAIANLLLFFLILVINSSTAEAAVSASISKSMLIMDKIAETLHYENVPPNKNGDYKYEYQTTNGITAKVAGNSYGASGVLQYISNDGIPITLSYTADEDGYHPVGDHIPKTPDYILRSLEYIKKHRKIDTTHNNNNDYHNKL